MTATVCIFYTSIGGLKAVVWTDTLQIFFMIAGFASFIIYGSIDFKGFDEIMIRVSRGGRIVNDFRTDFEKENSIQFSGKFYIEISLSLKIKCHILNFNSADPTIRHTFWSVVIGGTFGIWGNFFCCTQSFTQRMLACRTMSQMKVAVYIGFIGTILILALAALTGFILYAYNECCDPLTGRVFVLPGGPRLNYRVYF